jgi:curved DNA-binding protein CbpA
MSDFTDFAKILEQKIRREIEQEVNFDSGPSSETEGSDYNHMSWLLGQTPRTLNQKGFKNTLYQQYQPKVKPRPSHQMNANQKEAYFTISQYVCEFKDNFSAKDLKQAFRLAALMTHPDQGGSATAFVKVQQAYVCLQTVLRPK